MASRPLSGRAVRLPPLQSVLRGIRFSPGLVGMEGRAVMVVIVLAGAAVEVRPPEALEELEVTQVQPRRAPGGSGKEMGGLGVPPRVWVPIQGMEILPAEAEVVQRTVMVAQVPTDRFALPMRLPQRRQRVIPRSL